MISPGIMANNNISHLKKKNIRKVTRQIAYHAKSNKKESLLILSTSRTDADDALPVVTHLIEHMMNVIEHTDAA